jgi:hypothetical protein
MRQRMRHRRPVDMLGVARKHELIVITLVGQHLRHQLSRQHPEGDQGGNLLPIKCGSGCAGSREVHAYWDNVLGASNSAELAAQAAARLPVADAKEASIADEKVWIAESVEIAKQYVYAVPPIEDGPEPSVLTEAYKEQAARIAKERVALAGARLAKLIIDALKD